MDSAFSNFENTNFVRAKKFCKEKITPLWYKQSEISERKNFTFPISQFFGQFFRKFQK